MVGRTLRDKYARAIKAKNDAIAIIAKEYLQAQGINGRTTFQLKNMKVQWALWNPSGQLS